MTTQEAIEAKVRAQADIFKILKNLEKETGLRVTSVITIIDEGYGLKSTILTELQIKLEA